MDVAHVGLVHCDPCECKVKGFYAVFSIERNVSRRGTCKGCNIITGGIPPLVCFCIYIMNGGWCLVLHLNTKFGMTYIRIWICECSCNPKGMVCSFICKQDCKEESSIYISSKLKRLG